MVWGQHIATCLHCGTQWVVGDCITSTCPDCEARGHRGFPTSSCPACRAEMAECQRRWEEARAAKATTVPPAPPLSRWEEDCRDILGER